MRRHVHDASRSGGGHPHRTFAPSAVARDLITGARVLRGQPVARALLPVTAVFLTANASLGAVLMPFGIQRLGGSEHTGLLLSCLGAGFLAWRPRSPGRFWTGPSPGPC